MTTDLTVTADLTRSPRQLAELYFACWEKKDFAELAPHLAEDVTFDGPLADIVGRDECLEGLAGLARATTTLDVKRRLADEANVMTWFELSIGCAPVTPVVNWCEVESGRIARIRVVFDPREILAAG